MFTSTMSLDDKYVSLHCRAIKTKNKIMETRAKENGNLIRIEIKSIFGEVLFEYEKENNTIKDTLEKAVEQGVSLRAADLRIANLCEANICGADLRTASLFEANLCRADLSGADLSGANLNQSNLYGVNLNEVYLYGANLYNANLFNAQNIPYFQMNCPSDGSFIGWKKVKDKLIKLEIPEDAKRSSATTMKCRCDKAKILEITDLDCNKLQEKVANYRYSPLTYKVGEMVYPDSFDENRWNECSHGIHFFINKQDAINY